VRPRVLMTKALVGSTHTVDKKTGVVGNLDGLG
jgi:hypothetical protein